MSAYTKRAADVFAPTTAGGAPRGAEMGEAATWGTEVEQAISEADAGAAAKVDAERQAREQAIADEAAARVQAIADEVAARQSADEDLSDRLDLVAAGVAASYETRAQLFADLAHEAGAEGRVWGDSNEDYRGVYKKSGASGTGSWTRIGPLPMVTNRASDTIDGLMSADDKADFDDAKDGESTLASRLDNDRASTLNSIYASLTSAIAIERHWGMIPARSFPATAGVPLPPWLTFSRPSPASYVDLDGLLKFAPANTIRHDYDPDTGEYLGILLECEPATNRFLRSEAFDNAAWTKTNSTITTGAGRAPDGTLTACKLVETTASTAHFIQQSVTFNAAGKGNWSGWIADVGNDRKVRLRVFSSPTTTISVGVTFDPATGQFSNPSVASGATHSYRAKRYKNGWRISYSFTLGGADTAVLFRCELANGAGVTNYTGDGTSGVLIACWQCEERDFASSYIKTEAAAVTRERDVLTIPDLSGVFGDTGGMIYIRGWRSYRPTDIQNVAQVDGGSNSNSVLLRTTAANVPQMTVTTGGAAQVSLAGAGGGAVIAAESEFVIVGAWKTDSFALSVNGNSALTDDSGTAPPLTALRIGNRQTPSSGYFGHLRHIALFAQRAANPVVEKLARRDIASATTISGQAAAFFGDSITEFSDYPSRIGGKLGIATINVGFGGTRMSATAGSYIDDLSVVRIAQAIASGDWSAQIAAVATSGSSTYPDILARLMATDWSKVAYISIFAGTNDYGGDAPLGTSTDMVDTTYRGAINLIVDRLLTAYPNLKIDFVTPMWRARLAGGDGKDADTNPNTAGIYLIEYVDAEIEQAGLNKCPALDLYRNSGINKYNHATFLDDGLHARTEPGNQRLADKIGAFIVSAG